MVTVTSCCLSTVITQTMLGNTNVKLVHLFVLLCESHTTVTVLGFNFAVENFYNMPIFYEVPGTLLSLFC